MAGMILADSWDLQKRSHWEQRALESGVLLKRWKGFCRFLGCWKQAAGGPEDMGPCEAWRGGGAQSICGGPLLSGGRSGLELCEAGVGSPTRKLPVPWVEGGGLRECPGTEAGRTEGQQRPWCCDKRPTGDSGLLCRVTNSPMLFLSSKQSRKVGRSSVFTDTKTEAERG